MRAPLYIASALALVVVSSASAQFKATGLSGAPNVDANWTVAYTGFNSEAGNNGASAAWTVPMVAGVWQDNSAAASWISAWQGDASNGSNPGDNAHRFTYDYSQTWTDASGNGSMYFFMGWDNTLRSITLNGASVNLTGALLSPLGTDFNVDFGFCRADGLPTLTQPNCMASFRVDGIKANQSNTLAFQFWGDGQTDGMILSPDTSGHPQDVVPEPATMTLLATGLVGMSGASIRRRRKQPKA